MSRSGLHRLSPTQARGPQSSAAQRRPFHILAPSDAAFEQLLKDWQLSWEALCADSQRLRHLLLGHVLMDAQDVVLGAEGATVQRLRCANGSVLRLHADGVISDAQGGQARLRSPLPARCSTLPPCLDIDRVLRPAEQSLLDLLAQAPALSCFHAALQVSGLDHWLKGGGPLTLLALSNEAWGELAQSLGMDAAGLLAQPAERLRPIVARYILAGRWMSDELPWAHHVSASNGERLPLSALGLLGHGDGAQPLAPGSDQQGSNGVLHRLARPLILAQALPGTLKR